MKNAILIAIIAGFVLFVGGRNLEEFFSYIEKGGHNQRTDVLAAFLQATSTPIKFAVAQVIDGDTIEVVVPGGVATTRLIGINTPETVDPNRPVQCFGPESSARAKTLMENGEVYLALDPTQDVYDKYGRVLTYVFLSDGTFFNELLVREGYAREYTYKKPYEYQKEFRAAQKTAKKQKVGMWGACDQ